MLASIATKKTNPWMVTNTAVVPVAHRNHHHRHQHHYHRRQHHHVSVFNATITADDVTGICSRALECQTVQHSLLSDP